MSTLLADNLAFRALFTLPDPVHALPLAVQELPPVENVTGDTEVDAVLWLHSVIETGNPDLIARAKEALKRIKTPMKRLEDRYNDWAQKRGKITGTFSFFFGFGDFDRSSKDAIEKAARRREAVARFGSKDGLFLDQPAETACKRALRGLKAPRDDLESYDEDQADSRFAKRIELTPHTLSDCLYGLGYWHQLYWLRNAMERYGGDNHRSASEHGYFCRRSLARIRPRSKQEALSVLEFIFSDSGSDGEDEALVMRNLIEGGWA